MEPRKLARKFPSPKVESLFVEDSYHVATPNAQITSSITNPIFQLRLSRPRTTITASFQAPWSCQSSLHLTRTLPNYVCKSCDGAAATDPASASSKDCLGTNSN